jgi:hypothetical protein
MKGWEKAVVAVTVIGVLVGVLALARDLFDLTLPGLPPTGPDATAEARPDNEPAARKPQVQPNGKGDDQPAGGSDGSGGKQEPIPDTPVVDPEISLSPAEGRAGSEFTVTGSGFTPRGEVTVRFHVDVVAEGRTADDGTFTFTARAPGDLNVFAPKTFTVRAVDEPSIQSDTAQFALVL